MKEEFKVTLVPNKSTTYMLPFVSEQVNFKFNEFLLNSYLSFEEDDELFCVMYRWSSSPEFLKYEHEMMTNHLFVGHADFGDKVVYKFRLSRLMKIGRDAFIKGDYKGFSPEHKELIIKYLESIGATNIGRINLILSEFGSIMGVPPIMKNEVVMENVRTMKIKIETFKD